MKKVFVLLMISFIGLFVIGCGDMGDSPVLHLYNNTNSSNGVVINEYSIYNSRNDWRDGISPIYTRKISGMSPGAMWDWDNMPQGKFFMVVTGTTLGASSQPATALCGNIEFKTDRTTEARVGPGNSDCTVSGPK